MMEGDGAVRDPADDPDLCSLCGTYIGTPPGEEYCDACAREHGMKPPIVRCMHCGQRAPEDQMKQIDVSPPDEFYPDIEHLCRDCSGDADE